MYTSRGERCHGVGGGSREKNALVYEVIQSGEAAHILLKLELSTERPK